MQRESILNRKSTTEPIHGDATDAAQFWAVSPSFVRWKYSDSRQFRYIFERTESKQVKSMHGSFFSVPPETFLEFEHFKCSFHEPFFHSQLTVFQILSRKKLFCCLLHFVSKTIKALRKTSKFSLLSDFLTAPLSLCL